MFFEPLGNWRSVEVTEQRTKIDFAHGMKALADNFYPEANCIHVVMDNLNTHKLASLYEAFPQEVNTWQTKHNETTTTVNWQFTTKNARIKLKRLYPSFNV